MGPTPPPPPPPPPVPYDARIEYLESSGTQFINTRWYLESYEDSFRIYLDAQSTGAYGLWSVMTGVNVGSRGERQYYLIQFDQGYSNRITFHNSDANSTIANSVKIVDGSRNIYEILYEEQISYAYINKALVGTSSQPITNVPPIPTFIFAGSNGQIRASQFSKIRVYRYIVDVNNKAVIDMIPVRVGQVGYLYDKVSGQLFGNEGTGEFILGPDID